MRKIQQGILGVRFEAARQNLYEWHEAKTGHKNGDGLWCKTDPERGFHWAANDVQAYFEACLHYEHRSICSIVYERLVRRYQFVKGRLECLFL